MARVQTCQTSSGVGLGVELGVELYSNNGGLALGWLEFKLVRLPLGWGLRVGLEGGALFYYSTMQMGSDMAQWSFILLQYNADGLNVCVGVGVAIKLPCYTSSEYNGLDSEIPTSD